MPMFMAMVVVVVVVVMSVVVVAVVVMVAAVVVAVVVLMVVVWGIQRGRRQPQTRALQVGHPCRWATPEVAVSGVVCP